MAHTLNYSSARCSFKQSNTIYDCKDKPPRKKVSYKTKLNQSNWKAENNCCAAFPPGVSERVVYLCYVNAKLCILLLTCKSNNQQRLGFSTRTTDEPSQGALSNEHADHAKFASRSATRGARSPNPCGPRRANKIFECVCAWHTFCTPCSAHRSLS
eukprot:4581363-Amphidinium_carterae.1